MPRFTRSVISNARHGRSMDRPSNGNNSAYSETVLRIGTLTAKYLCLCISLEKLRAQHKKRYGLTKPFAEPYSLGAFVTFELGLLCWPDTPILTREELALKAKFPAEWLWDACYEVTAFSSHGYGCDIRAMAMLQEAYTDWLRHGSTAYSSVIRRRRGPPSVTKEKSARELTRKGREIQKGTPCCRVGALCIDAN